MNECVKRLTMWPMAQQVLAVLRQPFVDVQIFERPQQLFRGVRGQAPKRVVELLPITRMGVRERGCLSAFAQCSKRGDKGIWGGLQQVERHSVNLKEF